MEDKIFKKLEDHDQLFGKIDARFDKMDAKFAEHDARFDKMDAKFAEHDARFDKIESRLDDHDKKLDSLIGTAVDHGERLSRIEETMVTKTDYRHMLGILEEIATRMKRIEEDHAFAIEWLKRIQLQVDKQEQEIQFIKMKLNLVTN
ncbi:hypothetical protein HYW94_01500 [Candidatus Uhrbacteria bacterium]|nr:hypothetical protein [Candidatus Uhrbacteria bacterium]